MTVRQLRGRVNFSFIDHVVVFAGPLVPIAVFFQVYELWFLDKGDGLSLITWSVLLFSSLMMAIYATYHRVLPLKLTYLPLVAANLLIVLGILFHN